MDREIITWIDANGTHHDIDDRVNYAILLGTKGFYMPPISIIDEEVSEQAGSRPRMVKVNSRELDIPIVIRGKNGIDLRKNMRNLLRIFNPLKGDGKIQVTSHDGSQRELSCRYIGGLEIDEAEGTYGNRQQKSILVLKAFDPFWYDTKTNVLTFKTGEPATFFPFFPMRLSSSEVFADVSIDNTGDVETWPEWIITGPGENIVLRNLTTRELTHLDVRLGIGESITIDTRPFHKTVIKNDGTNLFYTLTEESSLWSLKDGKNNIRLEMANATEQSNIQLSYRNRYWGP